MLSEVRPAVPVQQPELVQRSQPTPQLQAVQLSQSLQPAVPRQLSGGAGASDAAPAPAGGESQQRLLRHFFSR